MPGMFLARSSKNKYAPIIPAVCNTFWLFHAAAWAEPGLWCTRLCVLCDKAEPLFAGASAVTGLAQSVDLAFGTANFTACCQGRFSPSTPHSRHPGGCVQPALPGSLARKIAHRLSRCGCSCPCPAGTLFCAHEEFTRASGNSWRS